MGVQDLQLFLESPTLEGGSVSVDLLKIARNVSQRQQPHNTNRKIRPLGGNKLRLIIDAENCLDRLYGGYYSGKRAKTYRFTDRNKDFRKHCFFFSILLLVSFITLF